MSYDRQKVLDIAADEIGYKEKASNSQLDSKTANAGSANYTKYGRDMHNLYPSTMDFPAAWCDAFVDWCFYKAYGDTAARSLLCGGYDDYTVNSAQKFKTKGQLDTTPQKGDQVFFTKNGAVSGCYHTGLVESYTSGKLTTIEGNSSNAVVRKTYTSLSGMLFGHPAYGDSSASTTTSTTTKLSASELAAQIKKGTYGNEPTRSQKLKALGYTTEEIAAAQAIVNGSSSSTSSSATTSSTSATSSGVTYTVGKTYTLQVDDLAVRTGAGTNYSQVAYASLTSNAKQHAYANGRLKKGTKVTCQAVSKVGSDIWMKIPSGWIAAYYDGKKYVA